MTEGTFVPSQPCRLFCQRLPAPTPWCRRHLLGRLVLATPGRTWLLEPAKSCSGIPQGWLDPTCPTPSSPETQVPSHLHVSIHKAVSSARRTFLLGKLFLLLQARPNLLGISPWVLREFVGVLLPGPGSGHCSLQEQGWPSARGLGPTGGHPALADRRLLPGYEATLQQWCLSRSLGRWGPSSQRALPQAWRVPPWRHHQPSRSVLGVAQGKKVGGGHWSQLHTSRQSPLSLQLSAPAWVESCLSLGATSWMLELEQPCVWQWSILTPQG